MSDPAISVIVPVYNGEQYLADALESILSQTRPPAEVIVVDDGSSDSSPEIVRGIERESKIPIRYVSQPNRGPAGARNCGVRLAMSGLIAFLDHDDLWVPNKLELQHNLFCRHADALVVLGFTQVVSSKESEVEPSHLIPLAAPRLYPHFQSAVFKKDVFDRVGPLDESMRFGEDIDWFLRAWEAGARVIVHEEVVTLYRRHAGNATNRQDAAYRHLLLAIKRSLERRRNADGVRSLPDFLAGVIR